jgi:putative ABC transport system ATP-binding protein
MDIELKQVVVRIPGRPLPLFSIPHFEVPSGSRILIHGRSGKGKTTLFHVMSGQFPPDEGEVWVGGKDVAAMDDDARSRLRREHYGFVFQKQNLISHLTVRENVLLGMREGTRDVSRHARIDEALQRMGVGALGGQRGGLLSPGEQQRVAMARVWISTPDIILADEPTSSLDGPNADMILEALWEASEGRTLIVVSHDQRIQRFFKTVLDFEQMAQT